MFVSPLGASAETTRANSEEDTSIIGWLENSRAGEPERTGRQIRSITCPLAEALWGQSVGGRLRAAWHSAARAVQRAPNGTQGFASIRRQKPRTTHPPSLPATTGLKHLRQSPTCAPPQPSSTHQSQGPAQLRSIEPGSFGRTSVTAPFHQRIVLVRRLGRRWDSQGPRKLGECSSPVARARTHS